MGCGAPCGGLKRSRALHPVFHHIQFWNKFPSTCSGGAEGKAPLLGIFFSFNYCTFQRGTVTFERSGKSCILEQPQKRRIAAGYHPLSFCHDEKTSKGLRKEQEQSFSDTFMLRC